MAFFYSRHHRSNSFHTDKCGFTMVEILVVITLSVFLLTLSIPFVQTAQARVNMRRTVKQLEADLQMTLNHVRTGKSVASLSEAKSNDQLPAYYGLYFEADKTFGNPKGYLYAEFSEGENGQVSLLTSQKEEFAYDSVFLKELRVGNEQSTRVIQNAWIFWTSPWGKAYILEQSQDLTEAGPKFNAANSLHQSQEHDVLELDFQYKDDPKTVVTLRFNKNKILSVDL